PEQFPRPHRARLAGEDQEAGLEGVLGVLLVAEHPPADAQDHGAVAAHQGLEGRLVAAAQEPLQELAIRQAAQRGPAQVAENAVHRDSLCRGHRPPSQYCPPRGGAWMFFRLWLRAGVGGPSACPGERANWKRRPHDRRSRTATRVGMAPTAMLAMPAQPARAVAPRPAGSMSPPRIR